MNLKQEIFIGDYCVISNGSILIHDDKDIHFIFNNLHFIIHFETDNSTDKGDMKGEVSKNDPNTLIITLTNFNLSQGRGLIKPIEVGQIDGKKMFLHFNVRAFNKKETKVFEYTWLTKETEVDNEG